MDTLNDLVANMPTNWAIEGQIEEGGESQDKRHAQLYLKTEQTRGTRVAKFFPHSHIEAAKNKFALENYVHKEDTRVAEFKTVENRSPSWAVVSDKFFDYLIQYKPECEYLDDEVAKWKIWDDWINACLEEGMRIEIIGINPQYRGCINKYWRGMWNSAFNRANISPPSQVDKTIVDKCLDKTKDKMEGVAEGGVSVEQGGGIPAVKIRKTVRARV